MVEQNILSWGYFLFLTILIAFSIAPYALPNYEIKLSNRHSLSFDKFCFRAIMLILFFMSAFRGMDICNDTEAYAKTYLNIASYGLSGESRMEMGYVYLNYIISRFFGNDIKGFYFLEFASSCFVYYSIGKWYEKHIKHGYTIAAWVFYFMMNASMMSAIRQSIAIAILLYAVDLIQERKYIRYIICVILATAFHQTALLALIFLFVYNRRFELSRAVIFAIVVVFIVLSNALNVIIDLLGYADSSYLASESGESTLAVTVNLILYGALLLLRLLSRKRNDDYITNIDKNNTEKSIGNKHREYSTQLPSWCVLFAFISFLIAFNIPVFNRVSMYFSIFVPVYVPKAIEEIRINRDRTIVSVVLCTVLWAYSVVALIYRPEWQHLWPYHFWWS